MIHRFKSVIKYLLPPRQTFSFFVFSLETILYPYYSCYFLGFYCKLNASSNTPVDNITGGPCPEGKYCPAGSVVGENCPNGVLSYSYYTYEGYDCILPKYFSIRNKCMEKSIDSIISALYVTFHHVH